MKKILITGQNSYIGTAFESWLASMPDKYKIDTIDMESCSWQKKDFSEYDIVFHVAGIVHIKERDLEKYYRINRDLALQVAKKAKLSGVKQFIFMSTMAVYGNTTGLIDQATEPSPQTPYAKSKFQAEKLLSELSEESFVISILRPPIVYGSGCRGNYPKLAKMALKLPVFPKVKNRRSMIHIDNLCQFVKQLIDDQAPGTFFPQNKEYVTTSEMVKMVAEVHGKKIRLTKLFNPLINMMLGVRIINKVFGNMAYHKDMSEYKGVNYQIRDFRESIELTEK